MKPYLLSAFQYNLQANIRLIEKIKLLPDQSECIKLFSHLINCLTKWEARIRHVPGAQDLSWWEPMYPLEKLGEKWKEKSEDWIQLIESKTDEELATEIHFIGFDGGTWAAKLQDVAIQLNNHAVHHRAQMQTLIRQQGIEPDFLDYIGTVYRKID